MKELVKFYRPYKGWIEIVPSECGKTWTVMEAFTVENRHGKRLTIPKGFVHDAYTFAVNLPDIIPAIAHDYAKQHRFWDDGTPITWSEWNDLLRFLMQTSWSRWTRIMCPVYMVCVTAVDWVLWMKTTPTPPQPEGE